ncbi:MAG: zinc-dependent alcohol dehydrogenase [Streptosporangiaceae bacterium]
MRAVVLGNNPWSLDVVDGWPEPRAGSGQVVVRVLGVGICGSDLELLSGQRRPPAAPWVPGHEAFGEVVATGAGVAPARVGERVVIEPNFPCRRCPACRSGLTSMCPDRIAVGFTSPGMLAEQVAVPAPYAWPVPGAWADTDAVCAEPLTVALAAIRRSGATPDSRCLVVGAGSQGALLTLALVARGITPLVLEPHEERRRRAVELGAREAGPDDRDCTVVYETSGTGAGLDEATRRAGRGATVMLIGMGRPLAEVNTGRVVRRQLTLRGSLIYDHPGDFAGTLAAGVPSPGQVLRACYPLAEAEAAMREAREAPGKTWIRVSGTEGGGS